MSAERPTSVPNCRAFLRMFLEIIGFYLTLKSGPTMRENLLLV
jgi:hypothetical protein